MFLEKREEERKKICQTIYAGKEPLCKIPLEEILAVERLHEDSFKMKNMFQIIQPQRALYVQAGNCVEEKEWIDILTKICQTNSNRLEKYHPSAYINGHWLWWVTAKRNIASNI